METEAPEADGALFFSCASEPMSGFSMSMYACMSEMAESDAPATEAESVFLRAAQPFGEDFLLLLKLELGVN